jgi:hypothetical protein
MIFDFGMMGSVGFCPDTELINWNMLIAGSYLGVQIVLFSTFSKVQVITSKASCTLPVTLRPR